MADSLPKPSISREVLIYALVFALVLAPTVYALTFDTTSEAGAEWEATPAGPTVFFDEDRSLPSGDPFPASNSIHIQTAQGSAFYNGSVDTRAQIDEINGTWSNVSQLDVTAGNLTIDPNGLKPASIAGDFDKFSFKGEATVDDGKTDLYYAGTSGSGTLTLETDGTADTTYGLVDNDTEVALDVAQSDANGQVVFDSVPMSQHNARIEELGALTIREETQNHELIKGSDVTVRFFESGGETVVERSDNDNDGVIDLSGLPVDKTFVAQVNADQHEQRTVLIEDLSQQENVFLLNDTATPGGLEKEFIIDDQTGQFDGENTEIIIQKAINQTIYAGSGGFEFLNMAGDEVGADRAYIVTLQEDTRYRILIRNQDGDIRRLGAFTPKVAGTTNLDIGSITEIQDNVTDTLWDTSYNQSTDEIIVSYNDTKQLTSTLYVEIHEFKNRSNKLLSNTTFNGPLGSVAFTQNVPASRNETTWVVRLTAERDGANTFRASEPLTPREEVLGGLSPWIKAVMSLGAIWITAGLFSQLNGDIGALVIAGMGAMFWYVGFAPGSLGVGVVVLSLVTAGVIFIRQRRGSI